MNKKIIEIFILLVILTDILYSQELTRIFYYKLNYITTKELRVLLPKFIPGNIKPEIMDEPPIVCIMDTEENIKILEDAIKKLDVKPIQVMIEAKFVEMKISTTDKYGVNWTWADKLFDAKSYTQLSTSLSNFATADSKMSLQFGTLRLDNFNAVLDVLLSRTDSELLSSPSVVTLDGKEATISTGDSIPYKISTVTGGATTITSQYKDVVVKLKVIPYIKSDGFILLNVKPSVGQVTAYKFDDQVPVISTREADVSVLIKDNDTFVIGGLLQKNTIDTVSKVPLLGDIPLLGLLFKKFTTEKVKTEIIIFITPKILKSEKSILPFKSGGKDED